MMHVNRQNLIECERTIYFSWNFLQKNKTAGACHHHHVVCVERDAGGMPVED